MSGEPESEVTTAELLDEQTDLLHKINNSVRLIAGILIFYLLLTLAALSVLGYQALAAAS